MIMFLFTLLIFMGRSNGSVVTTADFLYQLSTTNSYFWNNYVGIVLNFSEVVNYYNYSNFQGYILNSNINGRWDNNFRVNLRMPNGWYYDCAAAGVSATNPTLCKKNLKGNTTFFTQLGKLAYNAFG